MSSVASIDWTLPQMSGRWAKCGDQTESFHVVVYLLVVYGSCTEVYCQVSGQAMRGGLHRVRHEFEWWFGLNVEVLLLVPAKVYRSVENSLSRIEDLQGIGPVRQPATLDLEAANCLVLHFCFRRSVVATWISGTL